MEKKIRHLEMIQAVINRMGTHSSRIKGWCVVTVSALLFLSSKDADRRFIFVVYYPVAMFWLLDAYFLSRERLFRLLYDQVRQGSETDIDFSMDVSAIANRGRAGWVRAFLSFTLILFYGTMILSVLVAFTVAVNF